MAAHDKRLEQLQGEIVDAVEDGEERVMEKVNAVYALLQKVAPAMGSGGGVAKKKTVVSLDVDRISLVKGKKGKAKLEKHDGWYWVGQSSGSSISRGQKEGCCHTKHQIH